MLAKVYSSFVVVIFSLAILIEEYYIGLETSAIC